MVARAIVLFIAAVLAHIQQTVAFTPRFPYGTRKVRGVNLGGWLLIEPFITPSLISATGNSKVVDEYTFCQYQSKSVAQAALQKHWDTFITESDFAQIAAAGLNHVRIPIGFWAFDTSGGEPYVTGQYPYLQKAVTWAAKYGIKVLVDLHGLPGSQNGFDNSGRSGDALWQTKQSYIDRTNAIVNTLAHEFSRGIYNNSVVALAPVNEPAGFKSSAIVDAAKDLYYYSYGVMRHPFTTSNTEGNLTMLISDAFQSLSYWNGFMTDGSKYQGVIMDTHFYDIYSDSNIKHTYDQHIQAACKRGKDFQSYTKSNLWGVVGEWSLASTDCAKWLLGVGKGSRYDGTYSGSTKVGTCNSSKTGNGSGFPDSYKVFMRKFFEAQTQAFELSQGWIHWTWKTENAADWSYQKGLSGGWIPQQPDQRQYGNICNY